MRSGRLDRLATFQRRTEAVDGYGNTLSDWSPAFTRPCHVLYKRGGETVQAARLEGRQPVVVTVRRDPETDTITSDWRCLIDGRVYNVREYPTPSENRLYLEFLAESGVASG